LLLEAFVSKQQMACNLSVQRKMVQAPLKFLPVLATLVMLVFWAPGSLAFSNSFTLFSWKLAPQGRQLRLKEIASNGPQMLLQPKSNVVKGGLQAISTASVSFRDAPLDIVNGCNTQIEAIKKKIHDQIRKSWRLWRTSRRASRGSKCLDDEYHAQYHHLESQERLLNTLFQATFSVAKTDVLFPRPLTLWFLAAAAVFWGPRAELADSLASTKRKHRHDPEPTKKNGASHSEHVRGSSAATTITRADLLFSHADYTASGHHIDRTQTADVV
jgi:hypothetical protein